MSDRVVKIKVGPYHDGSGYQASAEVVRENGETKVEINTVYQLPAEHWPELRDAIEAAIAMLKEST